MGQSVTYFIKNTVPSSTWTDRIRDGARSWNETLNNCGYSDQTYPSRVYGGSSSVGWDPGDGLSRIDFANGSTLCGLTAVACTLANHVTHDFDIRIDSVRYAWSTIGSGCGANWDVWSIAAHEFGHTMAINENSADSALTMFPSGSPGQCHNRTLGKGDILGMRYYYP